MKKYIYILFALIVIFSSCTDLLDKQPLSEINEANFWKTPTDAKAGLTACYNSLQSKGKTREMSYEMWGLMDVLTPITSARETNIKSMGNGTHDSSNSIVRKLWTSAYRGVVRCNDLIEHIENIDFANEADGLKARMKGEALFLRALFYYQLTLCWGDVPLILKLQTVKEALVKRNSQADIIKAIYADLDISEKVLPEKYTAKGDMGRATKWAAYTLRAKTQLLMKDWAGAVASTEAVLKNGGYALQENFQDIFKYTNKNNSEVIFDIQFVTGANYAGSSFEKMYSTRAHSSWGWTWINPTLWLVDKYERIDQNPVYTIYKDGEKSIAKEVYDYFEGLDPRMDWTIIRPGAHTFIKGGADIIYPFELANYTNSSTIITCRKTIIEGDGGEPDNSPNNWILFRLADVMLMYAEAKTQTLQGTIADESVYKAVNDIRKRASDKLPLYTTGSKTKDQMLNLIYDESIRELALEGWLYARFKRWDMLKLNDGLKVMGMAVSDNICTFAKNPIAVRQFSEYHNLWPIPQDERDVNQNLTQNQGYTE